MLSKGKSEQSKIRCPQGTLRLFSKMTSRKAPYERMDKDGKDIKKSKKVEEKKVEEKNKENKQNVNAKHGKEKKKRKGWKRVRHVALLTCRYIGMGAAHMSPGTLYTAPDYSVDPKYWNRPFNPHYKSAAPHQTPHWTSNMMFSGW
ncbi:uncharacterized protein LOC129222204 [Uloborus diversus]|uniref:uncharacterized protein LOC129222204 n=1 Tax=Uloborus diversus TaxID=327109 RepID=UPI00240A308D|nr:uncharacterized protein LOC129222204 [Uloborus diversus]